MKHCKKRRRNTVSTTTKTFIAVILASYVASTLSIDPLALHQLIEVEVGGEEVISLSGYDLNGDEVSPLEYNFSDDMYIHMQISLSNYIVMI